MRNNPLTTRLVDSEVTLDSSRGCASNPAANNVRAHQAGRQPGATQAGRMVAAIRTPRPRLRIHALSWAAVASVLLGGCTATDTPTEIASGAMAPHFNHNAATDAVKGYLDGWFNGADVRLFYTKSFFCAEPPASGAVSNCVLGADAEVDPRPGPIPTIYAIAAVGFQPDVATLSCPAGSVCLNHPAMIDASRLAGPGATSVPGVPHSHIIDERAAGWWHTVNIRVFNLAVWNEIATAKSLAKVRELQADPAVGGAGLISRDTPTNIFFFIQPQPER